MNYKIKVKEEESFARARMDNIPVSLKQSVEVARFIKNKPLTRAYALLEGVVKKEIAVPFKRYGHAVAHKRNMASGRYPQKTAGYFIKLLKNAEANASLKGLSKEDLAIKLICADKGTARPKYGRKRGRTAKSTHLQVILIEKEGSAKSRKEKKQPRPQAAKKQEKPAEKPEPKPAKKETKVEEKQQEKPKPRAKPEKKEEKKLEPEQKKEQKKQPGQKPAGKPEEPSEKEQKESKQDYDNKARRGDQK